MLIIIVGPDGSGKSTLANKLAEQTGFEIEHRTKPKDDAEKLSMMEMYREAIISKRDVILDRAWYCEIVYGEVMRDDSVITLEQMTELEELMVRNGGGIIIHCSDETGKLWARCEERGEDYIKDYNTLNQIALKYEWLMHHVVHKIPVFRYSIDENLF